MIASVAGMAMTAGAATIGTDTAGQRGVKSALTFGGGALQGIGTAAMFGWTLPGVILGALTALPAAIEAVSIAVVTTEEKIEQFDKAIQESSNNKLLMCFGII